MAYHHHHHNNLSQELAFHHLSDHRQQHLDNNATSLIPSSSSILSDHHRSHRPLSSSPVSEVKNSPPPDAAPNWLNSAILRQQNHYPDANFINLLTVSDSTAATSNHWLPRSAATDEDTPVSEDSITPSATVPASQDSNASHNNRMSILNHRVNKVNSGGEAEIDGGDEDVMNWRNAKQKAEILAHPMYDQLLSAHVACLRIATPVDQLPRIDAQLAQSHSVVEKYASLGQSNQSSLVGGDDKELEQFMTHYFLLLCSFKEQLQQHVRVHAMEAVMACWETEQSLQSITGICAGEGSGATMSDDEDDDEQVESDMNMFEGESMGFGPLVPTESERSLMERVRQELKHELKQGYKEKIVDIREEILRKRRAGKLPGDTTSVLKNWWHSHSKWPYPTEEDKARLVQQTGLQLKQINNWFINQRKRNWNSNPSSSSASSKIKRKSTGESAGDHFM